MKDDTISRAAALTALNGCTEIYLNNLPPTIYKEDAIKAVKALPSAQPSATDTNVGGNLIDRQAALDALPKKQKGIGGESWMKTYRRSGYNDCVEDCMKALQALPSAKPGWIPCKTALPKDDTEVIVSCTDDSGDYEYSYVTTGWHYKGLWVVNNDRCYFVKAWQPLPAKPWEGRQDGRCKDSGY